MESNLPYHNIPSVPLEPDAQNIIARMADALAFRYYWATEDLKEEELNFKPSEDSMTLEKLLRHINDLILRVDAKFGGESEQPKGKQSLKLLRSASLHNLSNLSNRLKNMTFQEFKKMMEEDASAYPFWFTLNGPLADALTHVGQVVSWRRIMGNPQKAGVNVFLGKSPKE